MSNGTTEPKIFYAPVGSTDLVELGEPVIADFTCEEPSKGYFSLSESISLTLACELSPEDKKWFRSIFKVVRLPRKKKKAYKKLISLVYPRKSKVSTLFGNYKLR